MEVEKIVKINEDEQNALLRFFSRSTKVGKIEVLADHRKLLYKLKQQHGEVDISTLSYCALIIAIELQRINQNKLSRLNISDLSLEDISAITSQKAKLFLQKQFRKRAKRERLIGYWAIVRVLKIDEGYSFRKIESYLKKYHNFDVSYSLISKTWAQLENKKDIENG